MNTSNSVGAVIGCTFFPAMTVSIVFLDGLKIYNLMQIAQVHRATLRDGQEVVVKVQHDGIKEVILEVIMLWPLYLRCCDMVFSRKIFNYMILVSFAFFAGSEKCQVNS